MVLEKAGGVSKKVFISVLENTGGGKKSLELPSSKSSSPTGGRRRGTGKRPQDARRIDKNQSE